MARLFDGTNDSLQSVSTIDLSGVSKISVVFWLWWDAFANDDDFAMETSANSGGASGSFWINPNGSIPLAFDIHLNGNGTRMNASFTRPSAAAWHQYVFLFDLSKSSNEIDSVYVDGVSQSLTYASQPNPTGNFGNHTLNVMSRNNTAIFGAGRMAELAIYPGELLNASEALALARGARPHRIRPGSNPHYWPLNGLQSPEPSWRSGGSALTVNGGATATNHPPVRPFTRAERANYEEAVVAAGGVPRHYMYYQRLRAA